MDEGGVGVRVDRDPGAHRSVAGSAADVGDLHVRDEVRSVADVDAGVGVDDAVPAQVRELIIPQTLIPQFGVMLTPTFKPLPNQRWSSVMLVVASVNSNPVGDRCARRELGRGALVMRGGEPSDGFQPSSDVLSDVPERAESGPRRGGTRLAPRRRMKIGGVGLEAFLLFTLGCGARPAGVATAESAVTTDVAVTTAVFSNGTPAISSFTIPRSSFDSLLDARRARARAPSARVASAHA